MITIELAKAHMIEAVEEALAVLLRGGIVAYPTETFYALGARFDMPESLSRLYLLKKRPEKKAMPVIIGSAHLLSQVVSQKWLENIPPPVKCLMDRFWPGPLTLLMPAKEGLAELLTAGSGKVAVRIPGESFALHLAKKAGLPITATSANLSGMAPSVNAREVAQYFNNRLDLLVSGSETAGGMPSTIVDATTAALGLVREGAIARAAFETCMKR